MTATFDEYAYLEKQLEEQKNSKSGHKNGKSEKSLEREKDRHRDKHRDKKRDRSRDRSREKSRDRSREKSRDRGKDRDRDRDRDRERERDRDRDKDSKHRRRSRSRSRSRKSRSKSREKSRDKDRARAKTKSPRRERTPPEVRLAREKEKELKELERATRTVFAYNLNIKAEERDLYEFFSKAGTVTDIRLIMDRNTRKSKGLAYIEFAKQEEVFNALALTGHPLLGQAVMVKASEAEKNLAWEAQQQAKQNQLAATSLIGVLDSSVAAAGPCNLQVSNLQLELGDNDVRQLFEPFGPLDAVHVVRDATGRSTGTALVQFKSVADGCKAMQHWNGRPLADTVLSVTLATIANEPAPIATVGELDEDDDGFKLNPQSRQALMTRLANSAGLQTVASVFPAAVPMGLPAGLPMTGALGIMPGLQAAALATLPKVPIGLQLEQGILGPASPIPTPCLLLKNMFASSDMVGPEWEKEIGQDVKEECGKFGEVLHIYVDKNSKGFVYMKFVSQEAAQAAHRALNGRWYSGHQIVAEYQFLQVYNNHFKC